MKGHDVEEELWSQDMLNVRCLGYGETDVSNRQLCLWVWGINLGIRSMKPVDIDEIT